MNKDSKQQQILCSIQSMCLLNDEFMTMVFQDAPECIELVLRIILEREIKVLKVQTQVHIGNTPNRAVRLDVLATDITGKKFDVEVQRRDDGAGEQRVRYYSSMLDARCLEPGDDFKTLPSTYVIFITEHDVWGEGKARYSVERCFVESGALFHDGAHILYVNGAYRDDSPIGRLMHDFSCTRADEMYYPVLAERVRYFKEEKEGLEIMNRELKELVDQVHEEGVEKGLREGAQGVVVRLLKNGLVQEEDIPQICDLTPEEVQKLVQSMKE